MKYCRKKRDILERNKKLEDAAVELKKEFVGIDHVIDEVIWAVSSWYMFPEIQERPVIINLWGLTGTGKTSLVERLVDLLDFRDRYYRFDLGGDDSYDLKVKGVLEEIYENENGFPIVLGFDEFQFARTIDEKGHESDKSSSRIVWQVIDSGKFQISRNNFKLEQLYDLMLKLRYLLSKGVKVTKGQVVAKQEYFLLKMGQDDIFHTGEDLRTKSKQEIPFIPWYFHEDIYYVAKERFNNPLEVELILQQLNGAETVEFLWEITTFAASPKTVDCSKAMVFVIGNLDEAYTFSSNYNPDMNADAFYEESLKITVPAIKNALQDRFRNEQIARLGNTHIIYPAFSKTSFKRLIRLELSRIAGKVYEQQNVILSFDDTVHTLIYEEGVIPVQGSRPLFTTIYQYIDTKLGKVLAERIIKNLGDVGITFKYAEEKLIAQYMKDGNVVHELRFHIERSLGKLRKSRQDDIQAITAVHEAGHAIISCFLLRTLPDVIFSNSTEQGTGGFVFTRFKWKYVSRKDISSRLAFYLGGLVAEEIVFGKEHVTTGSQEDIERATAFITEMLKECGMGDYKGSYHAKDYLSRSYLHDVTDQINTEAEEWIRLSLQLARETLRTQEVLLLKVADYLSDNRQMEQGVLKGFLMKHGVHFNMDKLIENGDHLFYRKRLKGMAKSIEPADEKKGLDCIDISLNKKMID